MYMSYDYRIHMMIYNNVPPASSRQPVYGVQLFDDLHYYLPDLLYNNRRFTNIMEVFQYINDAMRLHFDRYSSNMNAAAAARVVQQQEPRPTTYYYSAIPTTFRILSNLINIAGTAQAPPHQHSIPPSPPDIHIPDDDDLVRETSIGAVTQAMTDRMCSICHENMEVGTTVRVINHCRHIFHRTCIDYWFTRSSSCPVCRHDICPDSDGDDDGFDSE